MVWFPTIDWFEQFMRALNRNPRFADLNKGWGLGWNGDMVFHLTDVPIDRYRLNDLPEELIELDRMPQKVWDEIPEETERRMRDEMGHRPVYEINAAIDDRTREELPPFVLDLLEEAEELFERDPTYEDVPEVMSSDVRHVLPEHLEDLLQQMEDFVDEERNVYAFIAVEDGEAREVDILDSPTERPAGFVLRGNYWDWEKFVEGVDVVESVLRGEIEPQGDMTRLLSYTDALQEMGDTAAAVQTDYLFREPSSDEGEAGGEEAERVVEG